MMSGILVLYGGSSMLHKFSIKGDCFGIIPYLGIFFLNILLFRSFQELNNYDTMCKALIIFVKISIVNISILKLF